MQLAQRICYTHENKFSPQEYKLAVVSLEQENARLKDKNKKTLELLQLLHYNFPDYDEIHCRIQEIEDILKESSE